MTEELVINKELMLKVAGHIRQQYNTFNMNIVVQLNEDNNDCGTEACIAGRTILLSGLMSAVELRRSYLRTPVRSSEHWSKIAADLLGLDEVERVQLFHVHMWPSEYFNTFKALNNSGDKNYVKRAQAGLAAQLLEDIASGRVQLQKAIT